MQVYARDKISLENLWCNFYSEEVFSSYKTLYHYHRCLSRQIDEIIKILTAKIIKLSSNDTVPEISPAERSTHRKLEILFISLDRLLELLHRNNQISPVLEEEKFAYLHEFFFRMTGKVLLKDYDFP
jgi:hypothetical protein